MTHFALWFYKRKSENRYLQPAWHTCSCSHLVTILKYMFRPYSRLINGYSLQVHAALHILGRKTGTCGPGLRYTLLLIFLFDKLTSTGCRYMPRFIFWMKKQVPMTGQASAPHIFVMIHPAWGGVDFFQFLQDNQLWSISRYDFTSGKAKTGTCSCCHRVTILKYMFRPIFLLDKRLLVAGTCRASHFG